MGCNRCREPYNRCSCSDNSCPVELSTKCIFYKGASLSCLNITKGENLEDILIGLNTILCDLDPSSVITYVVQGTTNEIVVTSNTVSNTTTFTVGLNDTILNDITTIQSQISVIQAAIATIPITLSTSSPEITLVENSANNWSINWTAPSSTNFDGIVYNQLTPTATSGAGGTQTISSYNRNYITNSGVQNGDEIRVVVEGQIGVGASTADTLIFDILDVNSSTVIYTITYDSFNASAISSFQLESTIAVKDNTIGTGSANISSKLFELPSNAVGLPTNTYGTLRVHGNFSFVTSSGIDYSNLTLRIRSLNQSMTVNTKIYKFTVEVRKLI